MAKYKHKIIREESLKPYVVYLVLKRKWSWKHWRRDFYTVYGFTVEDING